MLTAAHDDDDAGVPALNSVIKDAFRMGFDARLVEAGSVRWRGGEQGA
jgi:hypothetical protein